MADLEKTVSIIFKGKDELSKKLKSISGSLDNFGKGVTSMTQPLADMAVKVEKLELLLAGMAIGGLALAVKEAGKFSDSFNEISTLVDASSGDIDKFKQSILDYSRDSVKSIDDINASVYSAISAGIDYTKALDFMTVAEKLAVAGRGDLESTTILLASTLNAYGESVDQAGKYSDIFFTTIKDGQTTLPELAGSLSQVTGIAASAGIPIGTLTAAIAALTASGAPTSQAITQIRGAIVAMLKPSGEATTLAEKLGISFDAAALKSLGFEGMLKKVYEATGGSTDQMAKLFGRVEGLNAALILGKDAGGKFAGSLDAMANSAGTTSSAYEKMVDNFKEVNTKLANNMKATLAEIGMPLLDEYGSIANALGKVFEGVSVGLKGEAFAPVFAALESFGADLAGWLNKIAAILPEAMDKVDFQRLLDSVEGLGSELKKAFKALFGDVDITTPEGLAKAIQKVVDGIKLLTNVTSGIVEAWTPFLKQIGKVLESTTSMDEETEKLVGKILGMGQALNMVAKVLPGISGGMNTLAGAVGFLGATNLIKAGASGGLFTLAKGLTAMKLALGAGVIGVGLYAIAKAAEFTAGKVDELIYGPIEDLKQPIETTLTLDTGNVLELATGIIRDIEGNVINFDVEMERTPEAREFVDWAKHPDIVKLKLDLGLTDGGELAEVGRTVEEKIKEALASGATITDEIFEGIAKTANEKLKEIEPISETQKQKATERLKELETKAKTVQTAMEWKGKIDLAKVNAAAEKTKAIFDSINTSIDSTGDLLGTLFSSLSDAKGFDKWAIQDQIKKEIKQRDTLFDLTEQQINQQITLDGLRIDKYRSADALITVSGDGLSPHMEAFMWELLENIQIRASAEGAEFLLGIP